MFDEGMPRHLRFRQSERQKFHVLAILVQELGKASEVQARNRQIQTQTQRETASIVPKKCPSEQCSRRVIEAIGLLLGVRYCLHRLQQLLDTSPVSLV
jgi:hypothetical protein